MVLNQNALRDWYLALKSGEYYQGASLLRTKDDKFCCWGIACELAGLDAVAADPPLIRGSDFYTYRGQSAVPPFDVENWLGIDSSDEVVVPTDVIKKYMNPRPATNSLMNLNDMGVPFSVIADIIWDNYGIGEPPSSS